MKIKCGLDLDEVVYGFIGEFDNYMRNKGYKIDETQYDRGIPEINTHLADFSESRPVLWIPILDENLKHIKRLSKKMDFYIVTSRGKDHVKDTLVRLTEDQIPYKEVYFSKNKGFIAKQLGLRYFIEDNFKYAKDISDNSDAIVFLLDKPYNRLPQMEDDRIVRIKSLEDLI